MAYKHGVYAEHEKFSGMLGSGGGTVPAYIDTAPIWQLNAAGAADFDYSPYIGTPVLLSGYRDAKQKLGYSEAYADFGLCEAMGMHFLLHGTGPIVAVNVADPSKLETDEVTAVVTVAGPDGAKIGTLKDSLAAIENITVSELAAGEYTLAYDDDVVKITVTKAGFVAGTVTMTYHRVDVSDTAITAELFTAAVNSLDYCEMKLGQRPSLLVSPRYSGKPAYHTALIAKAESKIMEKWETAVLSDIPATKAVNTIALAETWKSDNSYISPLDKVFWPQTLEDEVIYHASTRAAAVLMTVDGDADDVPYISLDNKDSGADAACLEDGTQVLISEPEANELNEVGITTFNVIRGSLRFWGGHMANYSYTEELAGTIGPEYLQDNYIRMGIYLRNYLKYNWLDRIGSPVARRDIDAILASVQQWLNGLVSEGKLLLATIAFQADDNSTSAMASGDFVFNIADTYTPNARSLTFLEHYTADGLTALTGGES